MNQSTVLFGVVLLVVIVAVTAFAMTRMRARRASHHAAAHHEHHHAASVHPRDGGCPMAYYGGVDESGAAVGLNGDAYAAIEAIGRNGGWGYDWDKKGESVSADEYGSNGDSAAADDQDVSVGVNDDATVDVDVGLNAKSFRRKDTQQCGSYSDGNKATLDQNAPCDFTSRCVAVEDGRAICLPRNPAFSRRDEQGVLRCNSDVGCAGKTYCDKNKRCRPRKTDWQSCDDPDSKCFRTSSCVDMGDGTGKKCVSPAGRACASSVKQALAAERGEGISPRMSRSLNDGGGGFSADV